MIATRKRVPALFRWDVRDGLGANGKLVARSYGSELEGVFTRAGVKYVADKNGLLIPVAHSTPAFGYVRDADGALVQGLLLEPARTNLVTTSADFSSWDQLNSCTVTANTHMGADGTTTADTLTATVVGSERYRTVAFTGDGEKCAAVFLRMGSGAKTRVRLRDVTAATDRHRVAVTWTAGVPTLATESGAGTLYPVEYWFGSGLWRIMFSATGVVAANSNRLTVLPDLDAGTGSVIAFGGQAEDAVVPSSYIPTGATAVTRAADSLYFPFLAVPQEMTAYVRGVNLGALVSTGLTRRILHIGNSIIAQPYFSLRGSNADSALGVDYGDGTGAVSSFVGGGTTVSLYATTELRGVLSATWTVQAARAIDGGAEVVGAASSANTQAGAWSDETLFLAGSSSYSAPFAFQQVVIAAGTKTMDEMRALAEVA